MFKFACIVQTRLDKLTFSHLGTIVYVGSYKIINGILDINISKYDICWSATMLCNRLFIDGEPIISIHISGVASIICLLGNVYYIRISMRHCSLCNLFKFIEGNIDAFMMLTPIIWLNDYMYLPIGFNKEYSHYYEVPIIDANGNLVLGNNPYRMRIVISKHYDAILQDQHYNPHKQLPISNAEFDSALLGKDIKQFGLHIKKSKSRHMQTVKLEFVYLCLP